jgi:hypothetical protein
MDTDETQILNHQDGKPANLVGRSLLRRPDVWAARQRSPTGKCFLTRILRINANSNMLTA